MKVGEVYTPAYFRRLADYYHGFADTARDFNVPALICNRIEDAAVQFRYAAQAIEKAKAKKGSK